MSIGVVTIDQAQARLVAQIEEGQFSEVKATAIAPSKLTHTISAFANSDGGDLYIGIAELHLGGGAKKRAWAGFQDVEAANGHLQSFEKAFPLGTDFQYEFLHCEHEQGLILHAQINRTQSIVIAGDGIPYLRRGAQNLPTNTPDGLRRLEYAKGIASFESEPTNAPKELVTESPVTFEFLKHLVPTATPEPWLTKQLLLREGRPTVACLLLFSEEPQAPLPKRCGIKVYRYKTKDPEGFRDVLAFDPITVEGCLYEQIKEAVAVTTTTA